MVRIVRAIPLEPQIVHARFCDGSERMGVVKSGVTQRSGVVSAGAARAALVPTLPCQPDEALEAAVCEQDS